jgi:phosphate transport system substrate-binding protein
MKVVLFFRVLVVGFIFSLVSCNKTKVTDRYTDTYTSGKIKIAVDETFKPIMEEELEVYRSLTPMATITPIYTTEVNAIDLFVKDSVRVAIATRPLSSKELDYMKTAKAFYPRSYKLASDGIALIIHPANKDSLICVDDLRKILTGVYTKWNQVFPNSKNGDFTLVFDANNSSTVRYAVDSICKGVPLSKKLNALNSNPDVIKYVAKNKNAIGVIGVNWLGNEKDTTNLSFKTGIRVMSVSATAPAEKSNSFKPYQAYLFYGYYPLTRTVYVLVNDPRGALPTGVTSFLTSDKGQRIILKASLVPATQPVRVVHVNDN